jgi:NAD(P)-dependent dehydrogenase (short-subunit alcohol dehydrogenase family)
MSLDPLFSLEGRVIAVTGGLGKLGRHFTALLLERGARVAVLDVATDPTPLPRFPDDQRERLLVVQTDVTSKTSVKLALAAIEERWGTPEGLLNNAALDSPPDASADENGPFEDYPESSWDRVIEVNLKGVFLVSQVLGGAMAKSGRGSIVNINSIYGLVSPDQRLYSHRAESGAPFFKPIAYSASKSGLLNLTRYLATYWAPRNLRVNTLTFGGVFANQEPRFVEKYTSRVPLGRMANESDYAGGIVFLLSEASRYMTGSNLVIDGGWTAW